MFKRQYKKINTDLLEIKLLNLLEDLFIYMKFEQKYNLMVQEHIFCI